MRTSRRRGTSRLGFLSLSDEEVSVAEAGTTLAAAAIQFRCTDISHSGSPFRTQPRLCGRTGIIGAGGLVYAVIDQLLQHLCPQHDICNGKGKVYKYYNGICGNSYLYLSLPTLRARLCSPAVFGGVGLPLLLHGLICFVAAAMDTANIKC